MFEGLGLVAQLSVTVCVCTACCAFQRRVRWASWKGEGRERIILISQDGSILEASTGAVVIACFGVGGGSGGSTYESFLI
jgi:hypothetical protein